MKLQIRSLQLCYMSFTVTKFGLLLAVYKQLTLTLLMSGGNKRSYTYKYTELLLPPGIKG